MLNGGSAVIKDSNFISNLGGDAAAIGSYNGSHLTIENSLFYNNSAHREANATGGGGAIIFSGAAANLTNCTFANNYTSNEGGAIINIGTMTVTNSTFDGNASQIGGAISNKSVLLLRNSIIANSALGNNCHEITPITDGGGNLRWPASDTTCVGVFSDPLLSPLADNGGPGFTLALQRGSGAVRLATANCPATDQRGQPRSHAPDSCDAGAFEWQGQLTFFPVIFHSPAP